MQHNNKSFIIQHVGNQLNYCLTLTKTVTFGQQNKKSKRVQRSTFAEKLKIALINSISIQCFSVLSTSNRMLRVNAEFHQSFYVPKKHWEFVILHSVPILYVHPRCVQTDIRLQFGSVMNQLSGINISLRGGEKRRKCLFRFSFLRFS